MTTTDTNAHDETNGHEHLNYLRGLTLSGTVSHSEWLAKGAAVPELPRVMVSPASCSECGVWVSDGLTICYACHEFQSKALSNALAHMDDPLSEFVEWEDEPASRAGVA